MRQNVNPHRHSLDGPGIVPGIIKALSNAPEWGRPEHVALRRAGAVDLVRFVCDAVLFDGGDVQDAGTDGLFSITVPPAWRTSELDDMPGYDPDTRRVLLTRNLEITSQGNRPVGFLGRAHPLVRRALDRVRSLSYGADGQDHRISAVRAPVREPELLVTFLGRVASRSGTELERVLAVRAGRGTDPRVVASSEEWISSAAPGQGIRPSDLWKRYYAEWAEPARERCGWTAAYFRASAESFVETK